MGGFHVKAFALIFIALTTTAMADHELADRNILVGQMLYLDNCASCHGANLEGQSNWKSPNVDGVPIPPPHDATGHTWHHSNALLFEYTKLGGNSALAARGVADFNSGMPAFESVISDDDIWNILAYIRSTWPEKEKEIQANRSSSH